MSLIIAIIFGIVTWFVFDFQVIHAFDPLQYNATTITNATTLTILTTTNLDCLIVGIILLFQIPLTIFLSMGVYVYKRFERYSSFADAVAGECYDDLKRNTRMVIHGYDPRKNSLMQKLRQH